LAATRRPGAASKVARTAQSPLSVSGRAAYLSDRTRALLVAALVACATLPYLNILFNGFVYDDDTQLVRNPYVRSFRYLKEILTTNVWSFAGGIPSNYYRPMMTLGYLACYKLFGMQAYGFHLFSLLLHVLVVCLVFVLTERLTGERVWAFVAAAFFALHPVHTESVAWIAAVTDLELTFFYLLAFGLFLGVARPGGGRSEVMVAAMGCTFLLALLSKEQAMTLPVLATIYEHYYRGDRGETTASQKLARYSLLWLAGLAYLLLRLQYLGGLAPRGQFAELTPLHIALSAVALVGQYVGKLLWPLRLCAFYVFHPSKSVLDLGFLAGLLALLALAALFIVCWRSQQRDVRLGSFAVLWFLVTLAPVLNATWVGTNVFTERYLYLPSVGVAWLVGWAAWRLWCRAPAGFARRRALLLLGVALGGLYAVRIVIRNRDWKNDIVLYNQTLELSPDAEIILKNLGDVHWFAGAVDKAESVWKRTLAVNPDNVEVLNNLGWLATSRHEYAKAVEMFQRAIRLNPSLMNPHLNLGLTYEKMGLREQAELQLRAAVTLSPSSLQPHTELGQLLIGEGRLEEAEEQFQASLRIAPSTLAYDSLGLINIRRRAWGEAEQAFRAALRLDASDSNAHFGLGYIYRAAGRRGEALRQYEAGLAKDATNRQALAAVEELRQGGVGATP
jgi:tetratricopeptide (TPR) repeat protein